MKFTANILLRRDLALLISVAERMEYTAQLERWLYIEMSLKMLGDVSLAVFLVQPNPERRDHPVLIQNYSRDDLWGMSEFLGGCSLRGKRKDDGL